MTTAKDKFPNLGSTADIFERGRKAGMQIIADWVNERIKVGGLSEMTKALWVDKMKELGLE